MGVSGQTRNVHTSVTGFGRSITMVSERYDSGDQKLAGDGKSPKNSQEDDLDEFLENFWGRNFSFRHASKGCPKLIHPVIQTHIHQRNL